MMLGLCLPFSGGVAFADLVRIDDQLTISFETSLTIPEDGSTSIWTYRITNVSRFNPDQRHKEWRRIHSRVTQRTVLINLVFSPSIPHSFLAKLSPRVNSALRV
jgi:hypothetical protein